MNKRQRNKLLKKELFASLFKKGAGNKKKTAEDLWVELQHLGGSKNDTYAQALTTYGRLKYLEFYRVREPFKGIDSNFLWLQTAEEVKEQKEMEKRNIQNGGSGLPMTKKEIRIIWRNGKPV